MAKNNYDAYIGVSERLQEFRKKYSDQGSIVTKVTAVKEGDNGFIFSAEVKAKDAVLGVGHHFSLFDDTDNDWFAKAESKSVGRALKHAGFIDVDETLLGEKKESSSTKSSKTKSRSTKGGLGGKSGNNPKDPAKKISKPKEVPILSSEVNEDFDDLEDLDLDAFMED